MNAEPVPNAIPVTATATATASESSFLPIVCVCNSNATVNGRASSSSYVSILTSDISRPSKMAVEQLARGAQVINSRQIYTVCSEGSLYYINKASSDSESAEPGLKIRAQWGRYIATILSELYFIS
ncbi:hypothetical protein RJT34_04412 [Clitoria ternatea]|uniref:Uncharacterized protein n=1 Tax=Clitoria ternatea TaxID=43366 RepID=A0AAN9KP58_CLITE